MNYNTQMENIIKMEMEKERVPHLLLHSCCGPCSTHCIKTLTPYFAITIFYYNPNIEPYEEYQKRKEEQIRLIKEFPKIHELNILDCDYDNVLFHKEIKGFEKEKEGGARCFKCYTLRLEKTAQMAALKGFDYFGTTLTLSPLKNSKKLNEIGATLSEVYTIPFLFSDFKKKDGYKNSISLSKEFHLYRQDYCGCIYSKVEREEHKKRTA